MSTPITLFTKDTISVALLTAMNKAVPDSVDIGDFIKHFDIKKNTGQSSVELTTLVNGHPVDLSGELVLALKDIFDKIDNLVEKKALELIQKDSVLHDLAYEIEQADWKIRAKLEQLMNKD